jgi:hypothetical protein
MLNHELCEVLKSAGDDFIVLLDFPAEGTRQVPGRAHPSPVSWSVGRVYPSVTEPGVTIIEAGVSLGEVPDLLPAMEAQDPDNEITLWGAVHYDVKEVFTDIEGEIVHVVAGEAK